MAAALRYLLLLSVGILCCHGYKIYQHRIPNGDAVPHPCKPNNIWEGVGHFIDQGTGYRNPFGLDFAKEGMMWTVALCQKDSDGDGMTNGQELGDPNCSWKENTLPVRLTNLSHPGICDPWDSASCRSKNVSNPKYQTQMDWMMDMCKSKEFVCSGLNETGVSSVSMTIKNGTSVPAQETTYICQIFDFETMAAPADYHVIAVEPVLDNKHVIHHIVLFGCSVRHVTNTQVHKGHQHMDWGLSGDCFYHQAGITIGVKGHKKIAVQLHWNNPDKRADWLDSSGMKMYYTPNKRPYEASFMITGHEHFILPPLQSSVTIRSTCSSACTKKNWNSPFWVTIAWNHMHYAGIQMSVKVIRNSTYSFYLSNDVAYSYDSPEVYAYMDNPVQLLPGDELVTTCIYNTARRTKSTFWGEATFDEMCYGFLIFFPKANAPNSVCFTEGPDVSKCDVNTYHGCTGLFNYSSPAWLNQTRMYTDMVSNCKPYGPCLQECLGTILKLKRDNPCLNGEIFNHIKYQMWVSMAVGQQLLSLFSSCDLEVSKSLTESPSNTSTPPWIDQGNNSATTEWTYTFLLFMIVTLVLSLMIA